MLDIINWYLIILFLGWISFPFLYSLLPSLPGKGYSLAKLFGMLAWGYLFWILGRLGVTSNNLGGLTFPLLLLVGVGMWSLKKAGSGVIWDWIKEHGALVISTEILFLAAFAGMALIRAYNPEIVGTEKPMELAFINAIIGSESMPPNDPWLSGYAISYYYFGFVLVGMMAKLAGTIGGIAFNLGVSLTFALTAVGSYGLLFNLLAVRNGKERKALFPALLAPFFTLILSNWEGFLHYLHSKGLFWRNIPDGSSSPFWNWLDIQNLVNRPSGDSFGHWWWWRASRVIQDYDFSYAGKEVISEFPFFSFLLGDLHPHVLSLPYVFLILGFALALYLRPPAKSFRWIRILPLEISPDFFLSLAWLAGGMAFLNTWNFPMYVGVLAGAYALRNLRFQRDLQLWDVLRDFLFLGMALGITGGVLYLPWYLGFSSQAGGILPNVLYVTKGAQFWVMFGPLLVPIFAWLISRWVRTRADFNFSLGISITGILVLGLLVLMLSIIGLAGLLNINIAGESLIDLFLGLVGGTDPTQVVAEGLLRRIVMPGTLLTLILISVFGWGLMFSRKASESDIGHAPESPLEHNFILLLILMGMALVLFPEFIYLRDLFGYRINTIFKFYYQAWLLWSLASAYILATLVDSLKNPIRSLVYSGLILSMVMGLFYPVLALQSKTNNFTRAEGLSLDGTSLYPQSDYQGVEFLRTLPHGVIAEAVGGSYSTAHGRMATYTGYPTILGWDFHEVQWRGGWDLVMPRKQDVADIYCSANWDQTMLLMSKYDVRYLIVGDTEHTTYSSGSDFCPGGIRVDKFELNLQPIFQNERLIIYEVPSNSFEYR
jgi:YYY domain-containing protein